MMSNTWQLSIEKEKPNIRQRIPVYFRILEQVIIIL